MSDLDFDGLTDAQLRLFAVRCARRVQHLMTDQSSIAALDVAERHAKGEATDKELAVAMAAAWAGAGEDAAWAARSAAWAAATDVAWAAATDAAWAAEAAASDAASSAASSAARVAERAEQRKILNEIKEVQP